MMGNRGSLRERNTTALFSASTTTPGLPVRNHSSEEGYIAMTPATRKKLLVGKRFQHVLPKTSVKEGGVEAKKAEQPEEVKIQEEKKNVEKEVKKDGVKVEDQPLNGSQSMSLSALSGSGSKQQTHLYFMKSPTQTNRRYSLMDMKLNETKSQFTMKLKDRLRQSKLELGFDEEAIDWKEFLYKDNPGGRKSLERRVNFSTSREILYDANSSIDRKPVEVLDYNCQTLGLHGESRTRAGVMFPKLDSCRNPPILVDDAIRKSHTDKKKECCNCDHCTLAYLTDVEFPNHDGDVKGMTGLIERDVSPASPVSWLKSPGRTDDCGQGDGNAQEVLRIIDEDDPDKMVEVKIYSGRSDNSGIMTIGSSTRSSVSRSSFEGDSTNLKIRRLFQQYNEVHDRSPPRRPARPVPDSHRSSYVGVSIVNVSTVGDNKIYKRPSQTPRNRGNRSHRNDQKSHPLVTTYVRKPSYSSVLCPSTSSSLSTIMSYRRVKQIFQTIIEKNRPRKRTNKNIHKFLEMEELGLGEVRNNRWYPSDSKTKAIWKDITNARGVQAKFRKCHHCHCTADRKSE